MLFVFKNSGDLRESHVNIGNLRDYFQKAFSKPDSDSFSNYNISEPNVFVKCTFLIDKTQRMRKGWYVVSTDFTIFYIICWIA